MKFCVMMKEMINQENEKQLAVGFASKEGNLVTIDQLVVTHGSPTESKVVDLLDPWIEDEANKQHEYYDKFLEVYDILYNRLESDDN